jgi:hypothetical protein
VLVLVTVVVGCCIVKIKSSRAARPARNNKAPIVDARQQQFEHHGQILQ